MDARELRIGNAIWFDRREKVKWVNARVIADIAGQSPEQPLLYSPILLTEEWLLKFGFTIVSAPSAYGYDCNKWSEKYILRGGWNGQSYFALQILNNGYHKEIKYVHQLQNLYFALTGEELEIKETIPS